MWIKEEVDNNIFIIHAEKFDKNKLKSLTITETDKYYKNKNDERWVIYSNTIDASKIPVEWFSWMHFTPNKIEKKHIQNIESNPIYIDGKIISVTAD